MKTKYIYKDPKRQALILTNNQKIKIIEFYRMQKSNSIKDICIYFNLSIARVQAVIDSYLKHNGLILESKLNDETND